MNPSCLGSEGKAGTVGGGRRGNSGGNRELAERGCRKVFLGMLTGRTSAETPGGCELRPSSVASNRH